MLRAARLASHVLGGGPAPAAPAAKVAVSADAELPEPPAARWQAVTRAQAEGVMMDRADLRVP
jgi:hypothetical protein